MRINLEELTGYTIQAADGEDIGYLHDFYFDDQTWTIPYLVIDTGKWLPGRLVLVSPKAIKPPIRSTRALPVGLTKYQVEKSPSVIKDKPVTLQKEEEEEELERHFRWPRYWGGTDPLFPAPRDLELVGSLGHSQAAITDWEALAGKRANPHLRSSHAIIGYALEAEDGKIGHVNDLVIDERDWRIPYVVVVIPNWLEDKAVCIPTRRFEGFDWERQILITKMTRNEIEYSPDYPWPDSLTNDKFGVKVF